MKTIKKQITLILVGIFFTSIAFGKNPDTSSCLQISGKILRIKTIASNEYTVSLMSDNKIIETQTVKGNNEFKFNLKKNQWYMVKIQKEGYVPRIVSIDTKLAQENDGFYKFSFDAELIDANDALTLNKHALDMPIAHISFDQKKHWFAHNANYTDMIKRSIYNRHVQLNR